MIIVDLYIIRVWDFFFRPQWWGFSLWITHTSFHIDIIFILGEKGGGSAWPWSRIVELVSSQDLHSWLPDYSGDSWAFIDDFFASFAVLSNPYVVYINGLLNISFSSIAHSVRLCVTQTLYNSTVVWTHRMQQGGPRHTFLSLVSLSYG